MAGALIDIAAKGPQDAYLTENPTITFFKSVYRRHTAFSVEPIEVVFNGSVGFDRTLTAVIPTNGDLIHKTHVQIDLPAIAGTSVAWTRNIGHVLLKEIEIKIGGQRLDKHYGIFMHIWKELTISEGHVDGFNVMIGNTSYLTTPSSTRDARRLYVPLQFQYCRNVGSAIPLIALQYSDVTIEVKTRPLAECVVGTISGTPALNNMSLWVDYIHLDRDERTAFAQTAHEYLIEQLQFTGEESFSQTSVRQRLNFNHPCKALVWAVQLDSNATANRWTDFTDGSTAYAGADYLSDAKLLLNGHDRTPVMQAAYFNLVQPYNCFPRIPAVGIYAYSFAIKPAENQPSGSINFSRIDNATLQMTMAGSSALKVYTYAINNNVYRYVSGIGGSAYNS